MTLTKAYFVGSIALGLFFVSDLLAMLKHADYRSNNYTMGVLALGWVLVSLPAAVCFFKRPLYCLSPISYVVYFVINYFTAPKFSFNAEFDATHIAGVLFGLLFTVMNIWFLRREFRRRRSE